MLTEFDKRLALLEQFITIHAKTSDTRWEAVSAQITALGLEIRAILSQVQASAGDATASPAGRAIVAGIAEIRADVDRHDTFITELNGALRLARFALGTSFLSVVGAIVAVFVSLSNQA